MASKIKGLQQWCRKITEGYRDVDVKDFTVSWRDGLAFCAMIHRFRPDLIDFDSLSKENVYDNNHLAFTVAERELDIPAFLEASDMVALKTPDKLSIITYVSQYYNKLGSLPQLGGPGVKGKITPAAAGVKRHQKSEPLTEPEPKKVTPAANAAKGDSARSKPSTLGDRCKICGNKVYLLERHIEGGQLYHRSCYRHSDLSPTNKVYSQSPFFSPSLHGKDGLKTSTPKFAAGVASQHKPSDLSRTYDLDNDHTLKKHLNADAADKKSGLKKTLFDKAGSKSSEHNKHDTKDAKKSEGNGHVVRDLHKPSDSTLSTHTSGDREGSRGDKKSVVSPTFDARTFEKHSMDFLSSEKDAKDVKAQKRQLPLIFQTANTAHDKTHESSSKTGSSGFGLTSAKKDSDVKSSHASKSSVPEKMAAPVARPRQLGKRFEEKMDTTETVQLRDKTPAMPRPAPRVSLADVTQKKTSATTRSRSPARDLSPDSSSPPPLPSSAPPPLPLTAPPSGSPLPSPRHDPSSHTSHKTESHLKSVDLPKKSTHSAVSPRTTAAGTVPSSASSTSHARVPPHSKPLSGLTANSVSSSSTHTSATSVSSVSVSLSNQPHVKPAHVVFSIPTGARKEEPMDIETAVSRARKQYGEEPVAVMVVPVDKGQQEKNTLSGLLSSLANVRKDSSSSATSGTTTITTTTTTTRTRLISQPDKTPSNSSTPSLTQPKTTAAGFVSGKLNRFQSKDTDKKSDTGLAVKHKGQDEGAGAGTAGANSHSHAPHGGAAKQDKSSSKSHSSLLSKLELKLPGRHAKHSKGDPLDHTDEKPQSAAGTSARRDRSKSVTDVLSSNDVPSKKGTSEAPPFLQVKLRNATPTAEKKDRPKSAGVLLESEGESSRPAWQLEAERRMAALRDTGFVDPETKKAVGGNDTQAEQKETAQPAKSSTTKEQPSVLAFQKLAADLSPREDDAREKKSHLNSKTAVAKVPASSEVSLTVSKPSADASDKQKEAKSGPRLNILSKLLPSGKKDSKHEHDDKGRHPAKPGSDESKTGTKDNQVSSQAPTETEAQRMLKKITVNKDDHVTPARPASPPQQRKKIAVDIKFDFNSNDTLPREEKPAVKTTEVKHTPPPRPPPPRNNMSPGHLSAIELQRQLLDIDSKLTELELRGRQLEDSIRSVETAEEEDEMMTKWFQLVTEKNDLVRMETDLVYMSREQDLEGEQSRIENQLHYLLSKDDADKSLEEKQEEEYLIQQKLKIVDQRNCIVDSMDEDRLRYEEEDRDIEQMLHAKGLSKDASGQMVSGKGKHVASSTFYA